MSRLGFNWERKGRRDGTLFLSFAGCELLGSEREEERRRGLG